MVINLPIDLEKPIRAKVSSGRFVSEDAMVAEIMRNYFRQGKQTLDSQEFADPIPSATAIPTNRKPLWERAAELRRSIPAEEWAKLPSYGSE